jgi:large subunit ribosomal protein L24
MTERVNTKLKVGDTVMVIAGGNRLKRPNKGKVGKIIAFVGDARDHIVVEDVNSGVRHVKAKTAFELGGILSRLRPIHISNAMFYSDKLKRPVRLKTKELEDGTRVRGFRNPENGEFEQL